MTVPGGAPPRQDPGSGSPLVRVKGLTRRYGDVVALSGVDVEVWAGEAVGIIGPNGAGKSTFLDVVCGLLRPSSGAVTVAGGPPGSAAAAAAVGRLFEEPVTFPHLPPRRIPAALGMAPAARAEFRRLVGELGIPERRSGSFSKGELTRLGLAVALARSPKVLALDEPTSGLDPEATETVETLARSSTASGSALVVATHRIEDVRAMTDRTVVFDAGRVLYDAPTAEFLGLAVRVEVTPVGHPSVGEALAGIRHRLVATGSGAVEVVSVDPAVAAERLRGVAGVTVATRPSLASALKQVRLREVDR